VAENRNMTVNEDQILSFLQDTVARIRIDEDPVELNVYRRLFRKGVPLTLRSYFAAWILKQLQSGQRIQLDTSRSGNGRSASPDRRGRQDRQGRMTEGRSKRDAQSSRQDRQNQRTEKANRPEESRTAEVRVAEPRPVLPESEATTLFVSIGRNRRVYPRDLVALVVQTAGIDRDHIGEIRVLDNYSFVQVLTVDAEAVIAALNEFEYRGRRLAVSYSRKREEAPAEKIVDDSLSGDSWTDTDPETESDTDSFEPDNPETDDLSQD